MEIDNPPDDNDADAAAVIDLPNDNIIGDDNVHDHDDYSQSDTHIPAYITDCMHGVITDQQCIRNIIEHGQIPLSLLHAKSASVTCKCTEIGTDAYDHDIVCNFIPHTIDLDHHRPFLLAAICEQHADFTPDSLFKAFFEFIVSHDDSLPLIDITQNASKLLWSRRSLDAWLSLKLWIECLVIYCEWIIDPNTHSALTSYFTESLHISKDSLDTRRMIEYPGCVPMTSKQHKERQKKRCRFASDLHHPLLSFCMVMPQSYDIRTCQEECHVGLVNSIVPHCGQTPDLIQATILQCAYNLQLYADVFKSVCTPHQAIVPLIYFVDYLHTCIPNDDASVRELIRSNLVCVMRE